MLRMIGIYIILFLESEVSKNCPILFGVKRCLHYLGKRGVGFMTGKKTLLASEETENKEK